MNKGKKSTVENLFYNNKFLMVFSIVVAIAVWATIKINYSAETTRNISDISIKIDNTVSQAGDYEAFVGPDNLLAQVEVSGKAYNINQHALSKDDIIVETASTYVESAGYKVLTLTARIADASDVQGVEILSVSPSTITVYFDRRSTDTFNVEAKLKNDLKALAADEFTVGQPVPSMSTVEVSGPASILNKINTVYFTASINDADLPLTASKEVPAEISYNLDRTDEEKFLVCEGINEEKPATVTVPVYITKKVDTGVKFINQPGIYSENPPKVRISPSQAHILFNSKGEDDMQTLYVGTIDFRTVSNKLNTFKFPVDDKMASSIVGDNIDEFTVTLDMSSMSSITLDKAPGKVVFLNGSENYTYSIDYENSNLGSIQVIGPKKSLDKITAENIQMEINVSSLDLNRRSSQIVEVSNISIQSEEVNDCWVYGKYEVAITATAK
ncbi:MAG: YbbR-like domain-containing protein [Acutalibacteraceae bacterium]